jgi:hypothetical protein
LLRHWVVAFITVLVFVGIAVAVGVKRTPRYTATANVAVGLGYLSNPAGLGSAVQGTASLASVYSRFIDSNEVRAETARSLAKRSLSPSGELSASPVPESALIRVTAEATSERRAVALANAASAALVAYVHQQAVADHTAAKLLKRYRRAALRHRQLLSVRDRRLKEFDANRSKANRAALERAGAAVDTAELRRNTLLTGYSEAIRASDSSPQLKIVRTSRAAESDRAEMLQILVFVGLIGGVAAGAAVALLLAQRASVRDAQR